jgi:MSHA biogenesis protein MshI
MRFIKRQKKSGAWLAIVPQRDGILAARVDRRHDARPAVTMAAFFPGAPGADALERAGREAHSADYRCITVLGSGDYQLLTAEAPSVAREELKAAMRWKLKDILDFPIDDATFDVFDIPPDPNGAARTQHNVFAVAARNSVVRARQELFHAAKVGLAVIDIPDLAQRNVAALLEPEGRGVALLAFGEEGGLLTVSWRGELYLSRRIDVTLAQLREADQERKLQSFDKIALELQRSLDNFERQFSFISVAKLVLAPGVGRDVYDYLSSNLYTRVHMLDLADVLDLAAVPELVDPAVQQRFFVPLGAALRDLEDAA